MIESLRALVLRGRLGLGLLTEDRRVLEKVLLPYFAGRADVRRVLFVGCGPYTRQYQRHFSGREYVTLDVDPAVRRYGAARHVCDTLANVREHFAPGSLDLVICNGVFGWGLDSRDEVEAAFEACHNVLRPEGMLVVGWNDIPRRRPFPLDEVRALQRFERFVMPPLGAASYATRTRNRHTYEFFKKPV